MCSQVKASNNYWRLLKFLLWNASDTDKEMIDYQLTAHVFGEGSSASSSNFTLRRRAKDNEQQYDKKVTQFLKELFMSTIC